MNRNPWTEAEIALLRWGFADSRTADMAQALTRSYSNVAQKAASLGLRKSAEYLASDRIGRVQRGTQHPRMRETQFRAGVPPWSKGTKGLVGVQEGCRAAQFKPGRPADSAWNYVPIGSLRITKNGYLERKMNDTHPTPARRWMAVHRLVWEAVNGPIPAGHLVVFRRGAKTTDLPLVTVDRLELVTRPENMRRNSVHSKYPPELARLVQLRGALTRQINRKAKDADTA